MRADHDFQSRDRRSFSFREVTSSRMFVGERMDMEMSSTVQPSRKIPVIFMWNPLLSCAVLMLSMQATTGDISPSPSNRRDPLSHRRQVHPSRPYRRRPQQQQQCRHQTHQLRGLLQQLQSTAWESSRLVRTTRGIRGGQQHGNRGDAYGVSDQTAPDEEGRYIRDFPPPSVTTASRQQDGNNAAVEKIEKLAADFRAKRDDITAEVRARGEAIAAELKAKQEKIADEVLRDRSPEAFGELNGHHSHDSATAGLDVANRRSFFLGIRRMVLLVQVIEFITACSWQVAFPYGGVAGFLASDHKPAPGSDWVGWLRDSRGRLGMAVAAALGQAALYTILLVFFGCDRVVLRAVKVTGWEHGAAAAWVLFKTFGAAGNLHYLAASAWLAGIAFLCAYFGRQL